MQNVTVRGEGLGSEVTSLLGGLREAESALDRGDYEKAREMAVAVVDAAHSQGDELALARSSLFLAHCDRLVSRLRAAHQSSQLATQLFQRHGDREGEALALATHSYIAISLGRTTQAVEAAMLASLISDRCARPDISAFALTYLGFAHLWVHAFDAGADALKRAIGCARQLGSNDLHTFQPLVTMASVEVARFAMNRTSGRPSLPVAALEEAIEGCESVLRSHVAVATHMGMEPTMRSLHRSFSAALHCWRGDLSLAKQHLHESAGWSSKYPFATWLDALHIWVKSEIALRTGDLVAAEALIRQAIEVAARVEHETFGCMLRRVLIHNLETQGLLGFALEEVRHLQAHEDRVRLASLDGRQEIAAWQLDLRDSRARVQVLSQKSAEFEHLALHDALTGLPNRRQFESTASEMLRRPAGPGPMWLVWLDVDRFKQVNDTHGHDVGDQVLKLVAQAIKSAVRSKDLAARWAGDEFVVALPDAESEVAAQIAGRIRLAVTEAPFGSIVPGLKSTVSVGLAQACPGDSLESLLERSDLSMYGAKRGSAATD